MDDEQPTPSSSSVGGGGLEGSERSDNSLGMPEIGRENRSDGAAAKDSPMSAMNAAADDDDDENDTSERPHTATTPDYDVDEEEQETITASAVAEELDQSASDYLVRSFLNAKSGETDRQTRERLRDKSNASSKHNRNNTRREADASSSRSSNNDDSDSYYSPSSGSDSSSEDFSATFESIRRDCELQKSKGTKKGQTPEGAPAPLGASLHNDDNTGSPTRIPRKSRTGRGPGPGGFGSGREGPGRVGPGKNERRMSSGSGLLRALSGTSMVKSLSSKGLGKSSSSKGLGGGSPKRERGRQAPGRGRGGRGLGASKAFPDIADENSGSRRGRPMFQRAATDRFVYKPDDDDENDPRAIPKFKRKGRSLSMDLGSGAKSVEADFVRSGTGGNRYAVAFGASREQSHYQPKIIRKSRKLDIQTGGETQREVICQRIIDYPLAMNPAERRRKVAFRTAKENDNRFSMHGECHEPQYRLQSKVQASGVRIYMCYQYIQYSTSSICERNIFRWIISPTRRHLMSSCPQFKEQIESQTISSQTDNHPGALTTYLIWSLRSPFLVVLFSEMIAFWILTTTFAICIYLGAKYQPECLRFPEHRNFEEAGGYFLDAFTLSWTTFSTVVRVKRCL